MAKKLAYLASPYSKYSGGRDTAYKLACNKAADLMEEGYAIFCPIAHSHAIETIGMNDIKDGYWWLEQDFAILEKCDKLIVYELEGWKESYGVQAEIAFAKQCGIPVKYVS